MRSPASLLADSIVIPCFFAAVEMKPRTLWACHSVAFMISASVAPLARPIISRIFAPLLSARGALLAGAVGLAAFLPAFAAFFGAAALALARLAVFWPLGAPFFRMAAFFERVFSGATCAPPSATVAAVLVSSVFMLVLFPLLRLLLRITIHRSGAWERQGKSDPVPR